MRARLLLAGTLLAVTASAREPGYPYLDNETIGLFRTVAEAVEGPIEVFDERLWGTTVLDRKSVV